MEELFSLRLTKNIQFTLSSKMEVMAHRDQNKAIKQIGIV